jgi:CRP/FNR family transcriptional regulator, cyclic AMP receptor protein
VTDEQRALIRKLASLPLFRRLEDDVLRATAVHWRLRQLSPKEVLWMEGDSTGELGVVLAGELNIVVERKKVASLGPGELVGEGVAFIPQSSRMATVESGGVALVAVLERQALNELRQQHGAVYDALLADAVRVVARRVRDTDKRVARLSSGEATVPTKSPSAVKKLWQTLKAYGGDRTPPQIKPLLLSMLVHECRVPSVIDRLGSAFEPHRLEEGRALFFEGDKADRAFVISSGTVDVLRYTGGQKARKLTSLSRGSLFGFGGLLVASTRSASCVVSEPGWGFSIDKNSFSSLDGHAARFFHEILLKSLLKQVGIANQHLAELELEESDDPRKRRETLDRVRVALLSDGKTNGSL